MAKKVVKKKIAKKKDVCECNNLCGCNLRTNCGCGGVFYCLGFIGALIYYISIATGFWVGALGVLKAIVWPVFLIYEALKFLGA